MTFLATRKKFLEEIIRRADPVEPDMGQNIVRAVQTAMLCLFQVEPKMFEDYINAWRADLLMWAERLETVPRLCSMEDALEALALGAAQRGRQAVRVPVGTAPYRQVILDAAAAFIVYLMASNLRYTRAARGLTRFRFGQVRSWRL
jgi:hypothetical protein